MTEMKNQDVARIFNDIADLLEIKGENPFRIRAYRKAAINVESLTQAIEDVADKDALQEIPGIGEDLAGKIKEIIKTGTAHFYESLKKEIPQGILKLMTVPTIGPKTAKLLFDHLKIKTIDELEKAAKAHRIAGLPGMKEKTEENILRGIELIQRHAERMPLGTALPIAESVIDRLKDMPEVKRISYAGSLRRMKETVRDIDILITSTKPQKVMDAFTSLGLVSQVVAKGPTKSTILTKEGVQIDSRVVEPDSFGAALCYFTGSKAHNIQLRKMGVKKGLKINEYGVFVVKTNKKIAGKEEEDVYKTIDLPYIPPELREDTGEIEAAKAGKLPKLVELKDIKGDFHIHSKWSDGGHPIEELAQAAKKRGYKYIAVCDHSQTLKVAGGLSAKDLMKRNDEIRRLNRKLKDFTILIGTEVEILHDGKIDYPDAVLKELDVVIAAVHSGFKMTKDAMTRRNLKAMDNKYVNVLAHPTGRLMGTRDAYQIDLDKIFKKAKEKNIFVEINSYPLRLDLTDINAKRAKELGAPLLISTDTHLIDQFDNMAFGVAVARRAWLEKKDILNTCSVDEVLKKLKRRS